jgi:NNP family nitrate/nitrite transporter-like MFS transporter
MMKLLPLFVFWGLWLLNFYARAIFAPLLPLIEDAFWLSHGEATRLFTFLTMGFSISLLVTGRFVSLWGYKRTVVSGFIATGLLLLGIQAAKSYTALLILLFFLGVACGTYLTSIIPIITEMYDPKNWGKAIAFHDSAASFSLFSIPILVAIALPVLPWRRLFLILGVASLIIPFLFWKISIEPKRDAPAQRGQFFDLFKRRAIWIISLLFAFAAGSSMGIYSILPLYLVKERGINFSFANTLFGVSRLGGFFVAIFIGFLIDRFGVQKILMMSLLTTGVSAVGLSLSSTMPAIVTTLFLQAALSHAFFPAGFGALSNLTRLSERSMAIGVTLFISTFMGAGAVPLILGLIADHLSFQVGILCLGILTAFSSLCVRFLRKG